MHGQTICDAFPRWGVKHAMNDLDRTRTLNGHHCPAWRHIPELDEALAVPLDPVTDFLAVGGIDDHQPILSETIHEHIVQDPARFVADEAVAGLLELHYAGR